MNNEIENEICVSGNFNIQNLKKIPHIKNYTPTVKNLISIYFDDPSFNLLRNKIGIRLRKIDASWEQTLKLELTSTKKIEWNHELGNIKDIKNIEKAFLPKKEEIEKKIFLNFNYPKTIDSLQEKFTVKVIRTSWNINYLNGKLELSYDLGEIIDSKKKRKRMLTVHDVNECLID